MDTGGDSSSTDTGAMFEPCLSSAWVTTEPLAPHDHLGALRIDGPAVARLVFGGEVDGMPYTAIAAAEDVAGPWLLAQQLDGLAPHDIGDIDGDGRDDLVVVDGSGVGGWWGALPDGTLADRGELEVTGDTDALLRLPSDPIAGLVRVDAELTFAHGSGDGTFGAATTIDPPTPDTTWSAPVIAWGEGIISVGARTADCERPCVVDTIVLQIDESDEVTELGRVDAGGELLDIADLDGDGVLDLVLRETPDGTLRIHRGGQAMFDPPLLAQQTLDAAACDVDADGDIDLFTTTPDVLTIQFNTDFDLSSSYQLELVLENPLRLGRAVDLDGDGITEVVVSGSEGLHGLQYTDACPP